MRALTHGWIALWLLSLVLAGCATQETKVACDGKLQPINAPASGKVAQLVHGAREADSKPEGVQ